MSSFTSNAICTDDVLCSRELIEGAVKVINEAIHEQPESASNVDTDADADADGEAVAEKISNGKTLRVAVLDPQNLVDEGVVDIRFEREQVTLVEGDDDGGADVSVKVCGDHLRRVCADPQAYVEDPMKIELVWMKERMTA